MKLFSRILLSFIFIVINLFSFTLATTTTDFQHQNTDALPGVPKTPPPSGPGGTDLFDSSAGGNGTAFLDGIKLAINRVLGLLALIALIILIIQGVLMLVNARDGKKIEEGYTTVKNVAIALVFIGISWLIVSFIFWAIGVFTA